ncbi:glycerophosphodiester phosphodiesterase [Luteococcus peritonei]|uniref:Glycerophosphodiester phosphodiesterase n=1 Tax=Luteococcus peritonei TaxID=88874 RepID=A0ABW4RT61_9ACTN
MAPRSAIRTTPRPSRRALLGAAVGTMALGACGKSTEELEVPYHDAFVIAHRGGGRNWPEMTLYAYQQAAQLSGLGRMEVSVRRSRDGVLLCHHDATTGRVGTQDLEIAKTDWKDLARVAISPRETLDPSQPGRPLARFQEVLDAWPEGIEMWVEPKSDDAVEPLFRKLSHLPDLKVVWKRPINAPGFDKAKQQGWGTFGYVLAGEKQFSYLEQVAPSKELDHVGVPVEADDERIRRVVDLAGSYGTSTVAWALSDLAQRDRVLRLGCRGLMCSNIVELLDAPMPQ